MTTETTPSEAEKLSLHLLLTPEVDYKILTRHGKATTTADIEES